MTLFHQILEPSTLTRPSTEVAPALLGCTLVRQLPSGQILRGAIVETEAYAPGDPAFHAYRRVTPRNQVVFGMAGRAYVYQIYGMYHCLNVVTDCEGIPSAVLIRALQLECLPSGWEIGSKENLHRLAAGPGKLCRVLQIDRGLNGTILQPGQPLWLEQRQQEFAVVQTTRIGLSQGVDLPWRWYVQGCPAVSKV
ncbi:MAG: putative 3-methyladenine DNA glycosylase [Chroococcidiopsis sp. SAG 2025]|uniref:DNA-3-methyladenine glycosylase n=1 Tax=Chroococcidiopsis sp. SAG 2025 TaxID=171389 RepID=UPI0029370823|nr:DNA-3-methyladenine glycosylase [Chroococcidiopsis sp. SAG 2025]MDV2993062.1 putative 3-methyladenine DNA glycosylase [Chroococcidiopsis sp. SAG 2025]